MATSLEALPQLLELLYEGIVCPERWNDLLAALRRDVEFEMASVAFHDSGNQSPVVRWSLGLSTEVVQEWNTCYGRKNPVAQEILPAVRQSGSWFAAASLCDAPAAVQDTEYAHWARLRGIFHAVIAVVPSGRESYGSINVIRTPSAGPFGEQAVELVRLLVPHFQRAFQVLRKLETLRAFSEAGSLALDQLDTAFAVVDEEGRVVQMNERAEALLQGRRGIGLSKGRLVAVDSHQSGRLESLVRSAAMTGAGHGAGAGGATTVQGEDSEQPLSITVTPFRSSQFLTGEHPCALVFISDPAAKPVSREAALRTLFGLTPAECRLSQLLLEGIDLCAASDRLRVTTATARFMLKSVFHKTDCHRQSQLLRLLSLLPGDRQISGPEIPG